uniref:Uncharacterized protein n=1 Tax=Ficus carica TaxID=3494 RepID=A0AA88EGK2_FICCA|nr:hypothetical protein TIFTF001_053847 [Ficus carica]GMN74411.1 hypothetical protein TIFTF001_053849 [Ficus carica]
MLNGLVHGLNWIGLAASTTPWLCATVSNLPAILDQDYREMALQTVKCEMDTATDFGKYVL